jgi:F0F1-type ATP synthase delta subunit
MSKLPRKELARLLAERSQTSTTAQLSLEIAAYLLTEKRTGELESILRDIMEYRAEQGVLEAKTTSAHALNDEIRQDIRDQLGKFYPNAKQFILDEELDEQVTAGVRLTMANQQFDATVRTKLNHFKQLAIGKG